MTHTIGFWLQNNFLQRHEGRFWNDEWLELERWWQYWYPFDPEGRRKVICRGLWSRANDCHTSKWGRGVPRSKLNPYHMEKKQQQKCIQKGILKQKIGHSLEAMKKRNGERHQSLLRGQQKICWWEVNQVQSERSQTSTHTCISTQVMSHNHLTYCCHFTGSL